MKGAIRRETVLPAPVEVVWQALTDADELARWFGGEVSIETREGGAVSARWPDGGVSRGVVEVVEPLVRLAFRWRRIAGVGFGTRIAEATRVEFALSPSGAGTELSVVEEPVDLVAVAR